jgi:alkylation response protein AidB-like acyl-CoA dehydrogenase
MTEDAVMDFSCTADQLALQDLARTVLGSSRWSSPTAGSGGPSRWSALAASNLLGVGVSEVWGGIGGGAVELCLLLEACGRALAPNPVLESAVVAMAIERFGSTALAERWLPGLTSGAGFMTLGLERAAGRVTARRGNGSWLVDGEQSFVPYLRDAARVLVSAQSDGATVLLLVDPTASGVVIVPGTTTSGLTESILRLDAVEVPDLDQLGTVADGALIRQWVWDRAVVGTCALLVGIADGALAATAHYVNEREQFGRPIATFQAVAMHAADAYVDVEAMRLTTWQAAWRISDDRDAVREIAIAKFWASDGAHRVTAVAHHLHGGIGVTREYPAHRYLLWGKHLELSFGSAGRQLAELAEQFT